MRDPERIDKFCKELASIWKGQCSDWRFFQLFCNLQRASGSDLFFIEDEDALKLLKNYFNIKSKGEQNDY